MVLVLKAYFIFTVVLMLIYAVRHLIFTYNRLFARQRMYYSDIYDSEVCDITVLVPMHNEEKVARFVLDALLECDYDHDKLEIIPIDDNSTDGTAAILREYAAAHSIIRPLYRKSDECGKPVSLNEGMERASADIVIVFDADYRPAKGMLRELALAFKNPEAGAVMGRVVPLNFDKNNLTRLVNLERTGGYQVDQQARHNLRLIPQYGGTVGGFRKQLVLQSGGFDTHVLAEDTELTFRLFTQGYSVIYANNAECYEEVPETWDVRARQVRRWSRGHNQVMLRYVIALLATRHLDIRTKIDGVLLLAVYMLPFLFALGLIDSIALFFFGEMQVMSGWWVLLFIGAYNSFGNFAPFYEISTAQLIDGRNSEIKMLPLLSFSFYFYMWNISLGFLDALGDFITRRNVRWEKTARFSETRVAEQR